MPRIAAKLVIGLAITAIGMFAADNSIGTWKFNPAKSKSTSTNPIKSQTDVREAIEGGVKVTRTRQLADGTSVNFSYTCKYGAKQCAVAGGEFDVITMKLEDANTTTFEARKTGGKYHTTGRAVVSKDGKTRIQTTKGTDASGKPITSTAVFDKQ